MRRIVVDNGATYEIDLLVKLEVGDKVLIPTFRGNRPAKVTALTSDYKGDCPKVIKILEKKAGSSENLVTEAPEDP